MKLRRSPELGTGSGWEVGGTSCTQKTYPKSIKMRIERNVVQLRLSDESPIG
jgi:hypothetical protein